MKYSPGSRDQVHKLGLWVSFWKSHSHKPKQTKKPNNQINLKTQTKPNKNNLEVLRLLQKGNKNVLRCQGGWTSLHLAQYSVPDTAISEMSLGKSWLFSASLLLATDLSKTCSTCVYFILPAVLHLSSLYLTPVRTSTNVQSMVIICWHLLQTRSQLLQLFTLIYLL